MSTRETTDVIQRTAILCFFAALVVGCRPAVLESPSGETERLHRRRVP